VQERRGMMKVWNVSLVIVTFLLTMLGTFMTRSGIVQSVHAFGQDTTLAYIFISFIGFVAIFSFGYVIYRLPLLRSRNELDSWLSREFAFLVNNWILLAAALFILVATLFPTISEAITGSRITIATPFYTQWMTPIGLVLLFLTGVGPLIAWRRATPQNLTEQFAIPLGAGALVTVVLAFIPGMRATTAVFSERWQLPVSLLCFGLCAFVLATISQEFYRGTRVRQHHTRLDFLTSLIGLVNRNKRRYGGYVIHLGIVLMFVGFAGGSYKRETEATLQRNQEARLGRYGVRFLDLVQADTPDKRVLAANVLVLFDGKQVAQVQPAKWVFPHHEEEPVTHVVIERGLKEDLYLVLNGFDSENGVINLKIVVNPLVNWIWVGFLLLAFGTGIAFSPERAYVLAEAAAKKQAAGAAARAGVTGLIVLASLGLGANVRADSKPASAHTPATVVETRERTPDEKALFHKIVCTCGTCGRELLADCTCGFAAKERSKISAWLTAGKSKDEILQLVGTEAWAVPPNNWVAALLSYSALLLGAGGLVVAARRMTRPAGSSSGSSRSPSPPRSGGQPAPGAGQPGDEEYQAKLDDELSDLD
jgi:cytochrome c-type biogenesis protein CcmF